MQMPHQLGPSKHEQKSGIQSNIGATLTACTVSLIFSRVMTIGNLLLAKAATVTLCSTSLSLPFPPPPRRQRQHTGCRHPPSPTSFRHRRAQTNPKDSDIPQLLQKQILEFSSGRVARIQQRQQMRQTPHLPTYAIVLAVVLWLLDHVAPYDFGSAMFSI